MGLEQAGAAAGIADTYVVAPAAATAGQAGAAPAGLQDYVSSVRPQPDTWGSVQLVASEADPCLPGRTRGEVVDTARSAGLPERARVLTARDTFGPDDWMDTLFAPLEVRGSIVFVRNADEAVIERRVTQERVTTRI